MYASQQRIITEQFTEFLNVHTQHMQGPSFMTAYENMEWPTRGYIDGMLC